MVRYLLLNSGVEYGSISPFPDPLHLTDRRKVATAAAADDDDDDG
jgi:hypothetical protein